MTTVSGLTAVKINDDTAAERSQPATRSRSWSTSSMFRNMNLGRVWLKLSVLAAIAYLLVLWPCMSRWGIQGAVTAFFFYNLLLAVALGLATRQALSSTSGGGPSRA